MVSIAVRAGRRPPHRRHLAQLRAGEPRGDGSEEATSRIPDLLRRKTELAGIDVIVVHRLLKNRVPLPEYLLLTAPVYRRLEPATAALAVAHALELEGIGRIDGWYVDLKRLGGETRSAPRRLSWPARVFRHAKLTWRSLPFFAGRREACAGFRNLDRRQPRTS